MLNGDSAPESDSIESIESSVMIGSWDTIITIVSSETIILVRISKIVSLTVRLLPLYLKDICVYCFHSNYIFVFGYNLGWSLVKSYIC